MTTDLYPRSAGRRWRGTVVGIATGAGMIQPKPRHHAGLPLTDLDAPREELRAALDDAVEASFQGITIDSDTSTSDMVVSLSSQLPPGAPARGLPRRADPRLPRPGGGLVATRGSTTCCASTSPVPRPRHRARRWEGHRHLAALPVRGERQRSERRPAPVCDRKIRRRRAGARHDARPRAHGRRAPARGWPMLLHAAARSAVRHLRESAELYALVPPPDGMTFQSKTTN